MLFFILFLLSSLSPFFALCDTSSFHTITGFHTYGNYIAKAALFEEVEGQEVSKYITGEL